MRMRYLAASLLALGLSVGCDNDGEVEDEDAGDGADSGTMTDAGRDAGRDAGPTDSGPEDAGVDAFVPVCGAGSDGVNCPDGHCCGGECVANNDVDHCGNRCEPCTAPDMGTATCDGTTCGFTCAEGRVPLGGECVTADMIPAPRPIEPASAAFTLSASVRFRWALPSGVTGARLEICSDRACSSVVTSRDVTGDTAIVEMTPATPVCPTTPTNPASPSTSDTVPCQPLTDRLRYWRVVGRAGTTNGTQASAVWPFSLRGREGTGASGTWGSNLDVDGDGFADVLVGASATNQAFIHRGSSTTLPSQPLMNPATSVLAGPPDGNFGAAAASAGDVNGDGYADIIVSSPATRTAYIYHGDADGLPATVDASAASTVLGGAGAAEGYGASVSGAGDVNGDGYADVVIGAPASDRAFVVLGSSDGVVATAAPIVLSGATGSAFGTSVASIDVNADGFSDVIVGAPAANVARVFLGGATPLPDSTAITLQGPAGSNFGTAVSAAGDVNADGIGDLWVGAPNVSAVFGFYGAATSGPDAAADAAIRRPSGAMDASGHLALFGSAIGAGDVNGDGKTDLLVGAPGGVRDTSSTPRKGFAYNAGALGNPSFPMTAEGSVTGNGCSTISLNNATLGTVVASLGDTNGDGYDDAAFAAPSSNQLFVYMGGEDNQFRGLTDACNWGLNGSANGVLTGPAASGFGSAVASRAEEVQSDLPLMCI